MRGRQHWMTAVLVVLAAAGILVTIEAPEDGSLITFGNALAGIGYFDLHIHFPRYHRHRNFSTCRSILHRIVQQVKEGFGCPLAVM